MRAMIAGQSISSNMMSLKNKIKNGVMYQKKFDGIFEFLKTFFLLFVAKIAQMRSKDAAKMAKRCPVLIKKSAKMDSSTLEVYSTYTPSVDESIFAAVP